MITATDLEVRAGARTLLYTEGTTLRVQPGDRIGLVGRNGAGKTTTMRMILGLDVPTSGRALIDGRPYRRLRHPLRRVGVLLDARAVHPGRSARHHLPAMARSNGIPARRVEEVPARSVSARWPTGCAWTPRCCTWAACASPSPARCGTR